MMTVSGLLISCAVARASWATERRASASPARASDRLMSVMSWACPST